MDKLELSLGINDGTNIPYIGNLREQTATIKNFNIYKNFDFFNELIYYKNDNNKDNSYDYNLAISYHYTDDLVFSIKGINILDKARKINYTVLDIENMPNVENIAIPSIDRKVLLTMEYTF